MSSKLTALKAGSDRSCASESDFELGPALPATHTVRPAESAAPRAMRAASLAMSYARSPQPYSACEMRLAENEFVSIMSAPASM